MAMDIFKITIKHSLMHLSITFSVLPDNRLQTASPKHVARKETKAWTRTSNLNAHSPPVACGFHGVVVITCALHAPGRWFKSNWNQSVNEVF